MRAKTVFLIFSIAVILLSGSISQSAFADGTIDQNNLGKPLSAFPSIPPEPGNPLLQLPHALTQLKLK